MNPFGGGVSLGGSGSSKRYGVTLSVNARNVFNDVNLLNPSAVLNPPQTPTGDASFNTRFFGVSNQLAGGPTVFIRRSQPPGLPAGVFFILRRFGSGSLRLCRGHHELLDDRHGQGAFFQHEIVKFEQVEALTRCRLIFLSQREPFANADVVRR